MNLHEQPFFQSVRQTDALPKKHHTFRVNEVVLSQLRELAKTTGLTMSEVFSFCAFKGVQAIQQMKQPQFQIPFQMGLTTIWERWLQNALSGNPDADKIRDQELKGLNEAAKAELELAKQ